MSFFPGLISGSLVAGGIYYAVFSYDLHSRTAAQQRELKCLSERLQEPRIEAPPPAAARVQYHPRRALFVQRWNEEIEVVFHSVRLWDRKVIQWGKTLMGIDKN